MILPHSCVYIYPVEAEFDFRSNTFQTEFDYGIGILMQSILRFSYRNIPTRAMSTSQPWYESLPKPKSSPAIITVDDLHSLLQHSANRVVVIDVRRTDIEVSRSPGHLYCIANVCSGHVLLNAPISNQSTSTDVLPDSSCPLTVIIQVRRFAAFCLSYH
jgi:hypothetical protein